MKTISPRQLHELRQQDKDLHLLDVRTPVEHAEVHVAGARLLPLDQLTGAKLAQMNGFGKDRPLYILCRSGSRARQAAERLERDGFTACHVVEGGTMAWAEAGLPVERGTTKGMSLERQVRVAAGTIVLTGAVLAQFVDPAFIWVSGFIGAGLIFAGLTDTCAMGMLIAKMPWNQRGDGGRAV